MTEHDNAKQDGRRNNGGRRPGAGRPRLAEEPRQAITVTLSSQAIAWLDATSPGNRSAAIEALIQAAMA